MEINPHDLERLKKKLQGLKLASSKTHGSFQKYAGHYSNLSYRKPLKIETRTKILIESQVVVKTKDESLKQLIRDTYYALDEVGNKKLFYTEYNDNIEINRGLWPSFKEHLDNNKITYDTNYFHRTKDTVLKSSPRDNNIYLRDHQGPAVEAILDNTEGVVVMPAGSGKTTTAIAAICKMGITKDNPALILVNRIELANQWKERLEEFAPGLKSSIIGGGIKTVNSEADVHIALYQTINNNLIEWADTFYYATIVIGDEIHNVNSKTYNNIFSSLNATWKIGLSATPHKTGDPNDVISVVGPNFFEIGSKELYEKNILAQAEINVIQTDLDFAFVGDVYIEAKNKCPISCKKEGTAHGHKNNYEKLIKHLISDDDRNDLIAENIMDNKERINLVLSKRHDHFKNIHAKLVEKGFDDYFIMYLTGQESKSDRKIVIERINEESGIVVFSTIADEALDVPRLDVVHLTYPTKNHGLIKQQIGRVERYRSDKLTPLVFDYYDSNLPVINRHYVARKNGVYKPGNYKINIK